MLTLIILINLVSCAYVAGAFALQMTVHFPFLDEEYWGDNLKWTAYWFIAPLILELATSWSALEENWYPVTVILLGFGWLLNIPIWYYQIKLAEGDNYNHASMGEALIHFSRARGMVWVCRLILLTIWCTANM
tara:strand:+ start:694 stop:1092 length:399 start_codon:yes stop_codon:yes gene_type:complete